VVDRIFECEKISIVAYIDTVHQVSTSCSRSLTDLFCGTKRHEAMCDGTYIVLYNIYLTLFVLSVLLRYMDSDLPFGILKLFYIRKKYRIRWTSLVMYINKR
jgi:hypothetical protein